MTEKSKEESDKDKGTRVWMPEEVKKQLEALKIHPRQATHEIISNLLEEHNEYQKKE